MNRVVHVQWEAQVGTLSCVKVWTDIALFRNELQGSQIALKLTV